MAGDRLRYPVVGKATREFIDGVVADKSLKAADLRVAMALMHTTTTWSKLEDSISRAQLAALADVDERNVARAMKRLEAGGHITYIRSHIKGIASIVRLNGVATVATPTEPNGVAEDVEWGGATDEMGWPLSPPTRVTTDPEDLDPSRTGFAECDCDCTWRYTHDGRVVPCETCNPLAAQR